MTKKAWWTSKTFWVAVFAGVANIGGEVFLDPNFVNEINEITAILLPVIMLVLRLVTKKPVGMETE